jgi:hypothetical protein
MPLTPQPAVDKALPRKRRHWLLLMLVPLGILGAPFLFFAAKLGTELQSMLTGPVNIWNTTHDSPPAADLAGLLPAFAEERSKAEKARRLRFG